MISVKLGVKGATKWQSGFLNICINFAFQVKGPTKCGKQFLCCFISCPWYTHKMTVIVMKLGLLRFLKPKPKLRLSQNRREQKLRCFGTKWTVFYVWTTGKIYSCGLTGIDVITMRTSLSAPFITSLVIQSRGLHEMSSSSSSSSKLTFCVLMCNNCIT